MASGIKSFSINREDRPAWITFIESEYYPDILDQAKIVYEPVLERFKDLLQQCNSSEELFLAIAKEPGKRMVQLARVFRRYVSPDTSVEMLKRKTDAKAIVRNFGYRFRPIEQVRKAFSDRPTLDEAMVVLLYEYQTRGQKGYTLTGSLFEWFQNKFAGSFEISGPPGAGKDIYLPDILPGYQTKTPTDFVISRKDGTPLVIGFARYDSDRGGAQEDDRTGGYNRVVNEIAQYNEKNKRNVKVLFINDGPGLLLGSMWEDYTRLESGREDRVMVCTLKMLDDRLTEDWIES
jgi:hypothetical protein